MIRWYILSAGAVTALVVLFYWWRAEERVAGGREPGVVSSHDASVSRSDSERVTPAPKGQNPNASLSGSPGPPHRRDNGEQGRLLIKDCEAGDVSACDKLGEVCDSLLPGGGEKRMTAVASWRSWVDFIGSKKHARGPEGVGCTEYFEELACISGVTERCLSAGTSKALRVGCDRGCVECCEQSRASDANISFEREGLVCNAGDADACLRLARHLKDGSPEDAAVARSVSAKACQLEPRTCTDFAAFVGLGIGGERDEGKAFELVQRAREAEVADALCASKDPSVCRKRSDYAYLEAARAYAPTYILNRCRSGDLRSCVAGMLPTQRNPAVTLEQMNLFSAVLFAECPEATSRCPTALRRCEAGELRACLALAGRPASTDRDEFRVAHDRLSRMCASGQKDACIRQKVADDR